MLELKISLDSPEQKLELLNELFENSNYSYIDATMPTHLLWDFSHDLSIFSVPYKDKEVLIDLYGLKNLLHKLRPCRNLEELRNKLNDRDIFILHILKLCNINNCYRNISNLTGEFGFILNRRNKTIITIDEYFKNKYNICEGDVTFLFPYNFFTNIEEEYNSFKNTLL